MKGATRNSAIITLVTIIWLITVPALFIFFNKIIGWPWNLTLLMFIPTLLFFIPGGYVLAIAGSERSRCGLGLDLSRGYLIRVFVFGLVLCVFTMTGIWAYGQFKAGLYFGAIIASTIGSLSAWVGLRIFLRLLSGFRGENGVPPAEPRER